MEGLYTCLLDCDKSWVPEWVCKLKIDSFRSNAHIGLSGTSTSTIEKAGSSFSSTVKDPESAEDDDDNVFETMAVDTEAADCRPAEAKQWLEESLAKPKPTKKKGKLQRIIPPRVHKSKKDLEGYVTGTTRSTPTEELRPKRQAPMTEKMKSMKKEEQAKVQKRKAKAVEQEEKSTWKKAKTAAAARAEKQLEEDRANETDSDDDEHGEDDEEDDDVDTTEQQDVLCTSPSSGRKYSKVYADEN
jgi:hypothetical protein